MLKLLKHKTLSALFMIAGTAIGAGMLALPLQTAVGGFIPASLLIFICFLLMLFTAFVLLEANLMSAHPKANIISMAGERLGRSAQVVAWLSFSLLLYSVSAAYISAGGSLITTLLRHAFPETPMLIGILIFTSVFGGVAYFGTHVYDYLNKILMLGLMLSFLLLMAQMIPHANSHFPIWGEPAQLLPALPVIALSFIAHVILPSVRHYLHSDIAALKKSLLYGMSVALIFYLVWEFLVLNLMPESGPYSLVAIASGPYPMAALTQALEKNLGLQWVALMIGIFSFCALVTSFIAVKVSLRDFLADGLNIKTEQQTAKYFLSFLSIAPGFIFATLFPKGFTWALNYAGVFASILYGILPCLMVYKGRYIERLTVSYRAPGGKPALFLVILLSIGVILTQLKDIVSLS